jgi:hypothetical protein
VRIAHDLAKRDEVSMVAARLARIERLGSSADPADYRIARGGSRLGVCSGTNRRHHPPEGTDHQNQSEASRHPCKILVDNRDLGRFILNDRVLSTLRPTGVNRAGMAAGGTDVR